jgi:hypothetical protein
VCDVIPQLIRSATREGCSTAIAQAKLMVDLGVDASGALFPADRPKRVRMRKTF